MSESAAPSRAFETSAAGGTGGTGRPEARDLGELIAHILTRYHEVHRAEFPPAIRLARKVEAVHAGDPNCPSGLADCLATIFDDLEAHQQREERMLFPAMLAGGCTVVRFPIIRMMAEHREVEDQLARLRAVTNDHTPPADACRSWTALCEACRKIDEDLTEHMRVENEELFARFLK
jgi:regulator of cell morphogenesis and NO signaling